MKELLGEEHAAGLRNCQGRCADVLIEEAAELTPAHTESFCEALDRGPGAVERALGDPRHGTADGGCGATPCRRLRGNLGAAPEAGAKSRLLGGGGSREEAAVPAHRGANGTDGTAIDAGAGDGGEEASIKARIARLQGAIADVWIEN